jgi:hypothetical protein
VQVTTTGGVAVRGVDPGCAGPGRAAELCDPSGRSHHRVATPRCPFFPSSGFECPGQCLLQATLGQRTNPLRFTSRFS